MTQTRNFTKAIFVILALVFASSSATTASAQNGVNFSFSFNLNGNHGHHYKIYYHNIFHVWGHHHKNKHGKKYFVKGQHNPWEHAYKPKKKVKKTKINNKKQLVRKLRKYGYRKINHIQKAKKFYTVRATGYKGNRVWLKISRYSGKILARKVIKWNWSY